ncbi:DUF29 domain-containing protein [[Limnothrix rosea] IAM M-220]|uniref:DUF29 domain-containing protein n=1 Tax=[Limnothrix rosea] IAM M-220 TaxID=454133 RepID=UPI0009668140|nr:DUF29 domain-containing protein [[Limnothrix rosea] IAM M-220]OKH16072.1 hypothetical protein NIES208_11950 [[Limnothrix rosea] IAM M-220]
MLYEQDIVAWSEQQASYLRRQEWTKLDLENLVEEIEALGRSEQRALGSYLQVLMMHLLKCKYQPEKRTKSWDITISNCRDKIQDALEDMPSLKRFLEDPEWVEKYYRRARRDAAKETGKLINTFPQEMPFSLTEVLKEAA